MKLDIPVTAENRADVLRVAVAQVKINDTAIRLAQARNDLEKRYRATLQRFDADAKAERGKRTDALMAAQKVLVPDFADGAYISVSDDGNSYTIHKPGEEK